MAAHRTSAAPWLGLCLIGDLASSPFRSGVSSYLIYSDQALAGAMAWPHLRKERQRMKPAGLVRRLAGILDDLGPAFHFRLNKCFVAGGGESRVRDNSQAEGFLAFDQVWVLQGRFECRIQARQHLGRCAAWCVKPVPDRHIEAR